MKATQEEELESCHFFNLMQPQVAVSVIGDRSRVSFLLALLFGGSTLEPLILGNFRWRSAKALSKPARWSTWWPVASSLAYSCSHPKLLKVSHFLGLQVCKSYRVLWATRYMNMTHLGLFGVPGIVNNLPRVFGGGWSKPGHLRECMQNMGVWRLRHSF